MAQMIQAAALAHINEHIAFEYRKQLEEQLGVPLPKPDENLPEDVEVELSRLTAAAAQKLLQKDQAEAAATTSATATTRSVNSNATTRVSN
jgi:hypothetical protein